MGQLTEQQWSHYKDRGFLRLGRTITDEELAALRKRIDEIMLGTAQVDYERMMLQLDSETGAYADMPGQTHGHKGATLNYRKIQGLEFDPLFLAHLQRPLFREICDRVYGVGRPVAIYRAMFMNKPAGRGTVLPWHQDVWPKLDRLALVTVWTALDDSTKANGCMRVLPGSHKLGPVEDRAAFLTQESIGEVERRFASEYLEFEAGESVVLHNLLLHTSDVNGTGEARRAFSVGYIDGATTAANGAELSVVFGEGAPDPGAAQAPRLA